LVTALRSSTDKIKGISRGTAVLLSILLFNGIFYSVCILYAPGFSSDDFYIFALINKNPLHPFCINFSEIFFLFLRPVSYFSFWLTYHLFYDNSLIMKFFSLLLHLGVIFIVWKLLNELSQFTGRKDYFLMALLLFLFSVHPDMVMYILHINNLTELLMLLFYSAVVWAALSFLRGELSSRMFILSAVLMYILSILSKQNGMHFPLLLLFPFFIMDIPAERKKILMPVSLVLTVVMVCFSYMNFCSVGIPADVAGVFNKPFTAAGILLFTTMPLIAEEFYTWFLFNKSYAVIGAVIITAAMVSALVLVQDGKRKKILAVMLFIFTLLYPRIFALGGGRINTHLVLWMVLFLYYFLMDKHYKYKYIIPVILILLNISYSVTTVKIIAENNKLRKEQSFELQELVRQSGDAFVALSGMAASLHEYNYYLTGKFGEPDIQGNALVYKHLFPGREKVTEVINYKLEGDVIIFQSSSRDVFIGEHPVNRIKNKYYTSPRGELIREYRAYSLKIPDSTYSVVFHNGKNWELVSL
jgi:hypothetical protein